MFTLAILRVIGSSATIMTPCHSEIEDAKKTKPFQLFYGSLGEQKKKSLSLQWPVLKVLSGFSNISKRCLLCLNVKLLITTSPDQKRLLNKRAELIAKCRHENKFLLINYKASD